MSDQHEVTGAIHEVGATAGVPGWTVFTSFTFADGGSIIMQDTNGFASKEAATICADMATAEAVEEITDDLVRRARRAYMTRAMK